MNKENLHKLIDKYEENFYFINNKDHDEIFKWRAFRRFREVWFSDKAKEKPFSEMFNEARKEFFILMDNKSVCPSSGIVKVAEHEQEAVANLFNNVLFADDGGDIIARQNNIDLFVEKFNKLCAEYYPKSYKFKQDRHSASCYLAMFAPDKNYIYRHGEVDAFAQHVEFGKDIGSGKNFRLDYYYEMCDQIVEALKEHKSLLEKHFTFINEKHYKDESLHILAFDIIYCSKVYKFYLGMQHKAKKESIKAFKEFELREKERIERENAIAELENEIYELENKIEQYRDISLVNVEVEHYKYGKGIVEAQELNQITVQFKDYKKVLSIHKKFFKFFTLEDNDFIFEAMTEYEDVTKQIEKLKDKLSVYYK